MKGAYKISKTGLVGVEASCFGVTIPRHLITSQDTDFGDNVGFVFTGVSSILALLMYL